MRLSPRVNSSIRKLNDAETKSIETKFTRNFEEEYSYLVGKLSERLSHGEKKNDVTLNSTTMSNVSFQSTLTNENVNEMIDNQEIQEFRGTVSSLLSSSTFHLTTTFPTNFNSTFNPTLSPYNQILRPSEIKKRKKIRAASTQPSSSTSIKMDWDNSPVSAPLGRNTPMSLATTSGASTTNGRSRSLQPHKSSLSIASQTNDQAKQDLRLLRFENLVGKSAMVSIFRTRVPPMEHLNQYKQKCLRLTLLHVVEHLLELEEHELMYLEGRYAQEPEDVDEKDPPQAETQQEEAQSNPVELPIEENSMTPLSDNVDSPNTSINEVESVDLTPPDGEDRSGTSDDLIETQEAVSNIEAPPDLSPLSPSMEANDEADPEQLVDLTLPAEFVSKAHLDELTSFGQQYAPGMLQALPKVWAKHAANPLRIWQSIEKRFPGTTKPFLDAVDSRLGVIARMNSSASSVLHTANSIPFELLEPIIPEEIAVDQVDDVGNGKTATEKGVVASPPLNLPQSLLLASIDQVSEYISALSFHQRRNLLEVTTGVNIDQFNSYYERPPVVWVNAFNGMVLGEAKEASASYYHSREAVNSYRSIIPMELSIPTAKLPSISETTNFLLAIQESDINLMLSLIKSFNKSNVNKCPNWLLMLLAVLSTIFEKPSSYSWTSIHELFSSSTRIKEFIVEHTNNLKLATTEPPISSKRLAICRHFLNHEPDIRAKSRMFAFMNKYVDFDDEESGERIEAVPLVALVAFVDWVTGYIHECLQVESKNTTTRPYVISNYNQFPCCRGNTQSV
jgi:hypothetical protein